MRNTNTNAFSSVYVREEKAYTSLLKSLRGTKQSHLVYQLFISFSLLA
ncbi:hypothetical protein ACM55G_11985 [Flavobacterium sp. LB3P122]